MNDFRFAVPVFLWGILCIPFFYFVLVVLEQKSKRALEHFVEMPLWRVVRPEYFPSSSKKRRILWCLALLFMFFALARPQWGKIEEEIPTTGLDILVVLDVSQSMDVEDLPPSRLEVAKRWIQTFARRIEGDRIGLVVFAGSSFLASPLTTDTGYIESVISEINSRSVSNQGTDIGLAFEMALKTLDRGAVESLGQGAGEKASAPGETQSPVSESGKPLASQVVLLISDGEDHEPGAIKTASRMRSMGIQFFALGVGTEKGGPVPVKDLEGNNVGFKRDRSGNVVVSTFKPQALQEISETAGGKYFNLTTSQSELSELFQSLNSLQRGDLQTRKLVFYQDRYQWPLFFAILLLGIELAVRRRKKSVVADGLRTTVVVALVLFPSVLKAAESEAEVGLVQSYQAYLENQEGVKKFKEGKLDEAEAHFGQAQGHQPNSATLLFNQGVVEAKKGATDKAANTFEKSVRESQKIGSKDLEAKSYFNLGNALSNSKNKKAAVESYLRAIESAQKIGDKDLEKAAKKNLEALVTSPPPQKQESKSEDQNKKDQKDQQGQNGQNGENDSKDKGNNKDQKSESKDSQDKDSQSEKEKPKNSDKEKDKSSDKNDSNEQKDQGKGEQEQQNKDQKQQDRQQNRSQRGQFKSEKLTKEDAERIMQDISNREQQVRERLRQRRGRTGQEDSPSGGPDW